MEPTMGANDRLMRTVKSGQERPLNETPRPGVAPVFKSVGASGAPIASAPGKTFDHGDADRRVQSSPRVQINHGSRLDARGDVDTLAVELTPGSIPRSVMEPSMGMVDDLPRTNDRSMRTADSDHNHPLRISLQSSATPGFERAGPSAAQQYPSRAQLTADSARPESAVDRAPPQVRSMPDRDETGARHNTTQMLRTLEKSGQLVAQSMKIPAMPEPSVNEARPAEPVIHVSIGRVEIRATQAPNPSRAPRSAPKLMGLDEYLNKRGGRE